MRRFITSLALLAALALPLFAQFDLSYSPSPLVFNTVPGQTDCRGLTLTNSGADARSWSLLANPPNLLVDQTAYFPLDAEPNDLLTAQTGLFLNPLYTEDRLGRPESAARFLGGANYITVLNPGLQNTFSLSFWARPLNSQAMHAEGYYNYAISTHYLLWPDWYDFGSHGGLGIALGQNGIMVIEHAAAYMPVLLSYPADLSGWNHFAVAFSNHVPKLYVNGLLVRTGIPSQKTTTHLSHIYGGAAYGFFKGGLDDLCVYDSALTDAQALEAYQFTDQSRFFILPRWGELNGGEQTTLPVRLIDTSLAAGSYNYVLTLVQTGLAPLSTQVPVTVNVAAGLIPRAPENLTLAILPGNEIQLHWAPVTQSTTGAAIVPSHYNVYLGSDPTAPMCFRCVGSTTGTGFNYTLSTSDLEPGHRFLYVVACLE